MEKGKEKCEIMKAIRTYVANKYGVEYTPSECNHNGDCQGTCPRCDAELTELQEKLKAKGILDIRGDVKLCDMVKDYLSPTPEEFSESFRERPEGMMRGCIVRPELLNRGTYEDYNACIKELEELLKKIREDSQPMEQ